MTNPACSRCGTVLPQDVPAKEFDGGCPACLARMIGQVLEDPREFHPESAPAEARFGKYVLTDRLGVGGMGEVWKAWDTGLDRWVALKFIKGADTTDVARFKREAQTAAQLAHPNIAAVFDVGDVDGRPFIAMQLVPGRDLTTYPRHDRRRLVEVMRDAALAVHHAHVKGIVHRDLKPANLMVDGDGRVFVMDFGLAKRVAVDSSLSASGLMVGTPSYMSPEQAQGRVHDVDSRSDVYALGATLYELMADRPPIQEEQLLDLLVRIVGEEPKALRLANPRIDRDLDTIVMKCLEKSPARRYASAKELADDLGRWLAGEPVRARPISRTQRAWRQARRNKVLTGAVAGLVLVGLVAGAVVVHQRRAATAELEATKERLNKLSTLWMQVIEKKRDLRALRLKPERAREALEQAVRDLDDFIAANPKMPQGWYLRARGRLYLGRRDEALADARQAATLAPDFGLAHAVVGIVLLEEAQASFGHFTDEEDAANAKRRAPLVEEARREFAAWKSAPAGADRLGLASTGEDEVMSVLANVLSRGYAARDPQSVDEFRKAVDERHAEEFALWLSLVGLEHEQAMWLERALEWAPGYALARQCRARDRQRAGDFGGAIADYTIVIQIEPRNAIAFLNRGVVRAATRDPDGAIEDYTQAISIDPRSPYAYQNRAGVHFDRGALDEAIADWTSLIKIDPRAKEAYMCRGVARRAKNDLDGAIADWSEVIGIDPEYKDAHYRRGNAYRAQGKLDEAVADWSAMIASGRRHRESHVNRGLAREEKGDFSGAIADFTEAIAIEPRHPDAYVNRARVRQRTDDLRGAAADCEKALDVAPKNWPYRAGVEEVLKSLRKP